jgi:hypothetical protein
MEGPDEITSEERGSGYAAEKRKRLNNNRKNVRRKGASIVRRSCL